MGDYNGAHVIAQTTLLAPLGVVAVLMLGDRYACYHFAEALTGHGLSFDYRLRAGPATSCNAIALLTHMNYPAELVERARRLACREPEEVRRRRAGQVPGGARTAVTAPDAR